MRKGLITPLIPLILLLQIFPVLAWQIERPHRDETLYIYDQLKHVQHSDTDGYASVGLGAAIEEYDEEYGPAGGTRYG